MLVYTAIRNHMGLVFAEIFADTFNNVSRDEDNILDQKYICSDFYYEDLKF